MIAPAEISRLISARLLLAVLGGCILVPCVMVVQSGQATVLPAKEKCVIGATVTILENQSKLPFRARVDTGAKSCSIHVVEMEIDQEAAQKGDNIGKMLRFKVSNGKGKAWVVAKIEDYAIVTTSDYEEFRYKVLLTLSLNEVEKKVLVTLNDRKKMKYPLLLGRNFLRGDFLVDVELDTDG